MLENKRRKFHVRWSSTGENAPKLECSSSVDESNQIKGLFLEQADGVCEVPVQLVGGYAKRMFRWLLESRNKFGPPPKIIMPMLFSCHSYAQHISPIETRAAEEAT